MDEDLLIQDRSCGTCTLCCKVMRIDELNKPKGTWCSHCNPGVGCNIYEERPDECRSFYCGYRFSHELGEHWFPASCKIVSVVESEGTRIAFHVDPSRPGAWREQPFYREIKAFSRSAVSERHQVVVYVGLRAIVVLPDKDVDLGVVADDEQIITSERTTPFGTVLDALKLKSDDPRIQGLQPGTAVRVDQ